MWRHLDTPWFLSWDLRISALNERTLEHAVSGNICPAQLSWFNGESDTQVRGRICPEPSGEFVAGQKFNWSMCKPWTQRIRQLRDMWAISTSNPVATAIVHRVHTAIQPTVLPLIEGQDSCQTQSYSFIFVTWPLDRLQMLPVLVCFPLLQENPWAGSFINNIVWLWFWSLTILWVQCQHEVWVTILCHHTDEHVRNTEEVGPSSLWYQTHSCDNGIDKDLSS